MKGGHDAALADDVGGTGDPRAGRGEAEDVAPCAGGVLGAHVIREPRMTLGDGIDRNHAKVGPAQLLAALELEVVLDRVRHSRCAVSPREPTICTSPNTLRTLTDV